MKVVLLLILVFLATVGVVDANVTYCDNCTDCNTKIAAANSGDIVILTSDLYNPSGDCIIVEDKDGVVFDGNNSTIEGRGGFMSGTGVHIDQSDNITIKNIKLINFSFGVALYGADNNIIKHVESCYNSREGIGLWYGYNNTIQDCVLAENRFRDIGFTANNKKDCDNQIKNVTGSGGTKIGYYNSIVHLQSQEFSELILANADNSTFENVTVAGSLVEKNNGLYMYYSDNVTMSAVESNCNAWGVDVHESNGCTFSDVLCDNNSQTGIHLSYCRNCVIRNAITTHNGQCGMYLILSDNLSCTNCYTENNSFAGMYIDRTGNTTVSRTRFVRNRDPGLIINDAGHNLIYDNYFYDNDYTDNHCDASVGNTAHDNVWNVSKTPGENIVGGISIGGNYWHNNTCNDTNYDGICDTNYTVDEYPLSIDYLPLAETPLTTICGDVDCNGFVSANDVIETYMKAVDPTYELKYYWAADVDNNTYISVNDVIEIYLKAVDPEHVLNCSAN